MVSFAPVALLALISSTLALPTVTSPDAPYSTITSLVSNREDLQPEGSKVTKSRPYVLSRASDIFIQGALSNRYSDVPESKASSVASVIFEGAVQPSQYTSLAEMAASIYFMNGDSPNPKQIYDFATDLHTAYVGEREDLAYWSLVNYIRTEATVFNTKDMLSPTVTPSFATQDAYKSAMKEESSHIREAFASLESDPTGYAAIETLGRVASQYYHDISFSEEIPRSFNETVKQMNGSFIERSLMSFLGTV